MLKCREITERASDYLNGDLRWWDRMQFKMHLAMCRICDGYVRQLRAAIELARAVGRKASGEGAEAMAARLAPGYCDHSAGGHKSDG